MKKTICTLLTALLIAALLCGCGEKIKNDVPASEIAESMSAASGLSEQLSPVDENYVKGFFGIDPSVFGDWCVMVNLYGTSADEIGVFKAGDSSLNDTRSAVESYLQTRLDTWMDEYMPEEKPKLTGAKVSVYGEYVTYCILSSEDAEAALECFKESLT